MYGTENVEFKFSRLRRHLKLNNLSSDKARFPYDRFCRKDHLCRFKFLEATEMIIWKRSSQTTEVILAIETILAYGSSEIDSSSILAIETTGNHTVRAYIF